MTSPVWLFDLDDTLHQASRHAFPVINRAMTEYMMGRLGLEQAEACALRQHYWRRYGATLLGLIRHHPQIDPLHFLQATHPLPELTRVIHPMPGLRRTLTRLRGRKVLFTNGPRIYAETLLAELGVADCFAAVFGVEDARLKPKPALETYRRLLGRLGLKPSRCIMVEDSSHNLVPAKRLGIRTVWLRRSARRSPAADVLIRRLEELPRRFA
jgi:putative hydrolase of the HAD superfamily